MNSKKNFTNNIRSNLLTFDFINNLLDLFKKITFQNILEKIRYKKMLSQKNITNKFVTIYKENLWSSKESKSGEGSQLNQTRNLSKWLVENFKKLNIKLFVDALCGDLNWMSKILVKLDVKYIGIDIVPQIIKKNKKIFESKKIKFEVKNICKDKLPDCDLIMVRDCLFHLSYIDIDKFFRNLNKTKYKYLLTTTHIGSNIHNCDIISGDFRLFNLFAHPFNFKKKKVIKKINDFSSNYQYSKKILILIKKKDVPKFLKFE